MEDKEIRELEKYMLEMEIATNEEIELVTGINGYNLETLQDILYFRTGYHTLEQMQEN